MASLLSLELVQTVVYLVVTSTYKHYCNLGS